MISIVLFVVALGGATCQQFLDVQNGQLRLNGEKVFMSGMNIAWQNYGRDFGNGQYDCCTGNALEDYIVRIKAEGGNSLRIWVHCDGGYTPEFDGNGYVVGTDAQNTMTSDLAQFLDVAYANNVLVFIVLWNGATTPTSRYRDLIYDDSKLQTYIDQALVPMVSALSGKVALGGWEVMNEPEGIVSAGVSDGNPCFDTQPLAGSGAGWADSIPMQRLQSFINKQTAAIKRADPKVIVTLGSWSERAQTDQFGWRNYYTDNCLIDAGGDSLGVIDFYQMHTYAWEGAYTSSSPLLVPNSQYNLDKPNNIGEFSQSGGDGRSITDQFDWAYTQGYCGAWSWQANGGGDNADSFATQAQGLNHLRGRNDQNAGGRIDIILQ
uniref:Endo-1,4-beta-mannanase n=1 Tax=Eisenia fetida TaxID=6396 RepID=A0A2Z5VGG0_EISFE|nr:endo-1,4-beta-mannanase [Eisenia fetida]